MGLLNLLCEKCYNMRFYEFRTLDKSTGEKYISLPEYDKNNKLSEILNDTDSLTISNYHPKRHPNRHKFLILHKPKDSESKYEVEIYHESGSFPSFCDTWMYTIWKDDNVTEDEGELNDPEIARINELLENFKDDFRPNIKGLLNHCQYEKIVEIQMTL